MGALVLLALCFLAAAVPDLAPPILGMDRRPPDAFLALTAYLALRGEGYGVVGWGIALGFAKDSVSLDPFGVHGFVLGATAYLLARERSSRTPARGLSRAAAVFAASLLAHGLYVVRMLPVSREGITFAGVLGAFPTALFTVLFAFPLHALLDRTRALDALAGRRRAIP